MPFSVNDPVLPDRVGAEVREISLGDPVVTMRDQSSMMGGLVGGAVFHEVLWEDMLPPYADGHLSIRRWVDLESTILVHHHLEPATETVWCDPPPISNPQVAVSEVGKRNEVISKAPQKKK